VLISKGQASPEEIAKSIGFCEGTVRNQLTILRREGKVNTEDGIWKPTDTLITETLPGENENERYVLQVPSFKDYLGLPPEILGANLFN
jgi:predicted transcriptional regulator